MLRDQLRRLELTVAELRVLVDLVAQLDDPGRESIDGRIYGGILGMGSDRSPHRCQKGRQGRRQGQTGSLADYTHPSSSIQGSGSSQIVKSMDNPVTRDAPFDQRSMARCQQV
jgi:hypothetical protein